MTLHYRAVKSHIVFAILVTGSYAFAENPATICSLSTKYFIAIEPLKRQVRTFAWGKVESVTKIVRTEDRFIETVPSIWQKTYYMDSGERVVVEYKQGEDRGSGYVKDDSTGRERRLYACSETRDFRRE